MHILGKILAFLVICLGIASAILSAQMLQIRNLWMKQIDVKRTAYEKTVPELTAAKKNLRDRQNEYRQLIQGWGPILGTDVETASAGPGQIGLTIGQTAGLKQDQVIHVFAPAAGGQSTYVGPFKVTTVEPARAIAEATWPLRESDKANWPGAFTLGRGCHVYGSAPTASLEHLIQSSQILLKKEEHLRATLNLKTVQENEVKIATDQRDARLRELNGDPNLVADKNLLPQAAVEGLVRAIEDEDEARNVTLSEVDDLRHELTRLFRDVQRLQKENIELMRSLPGASPAEPSEKIAAQ